ncbi:ANTAR domain-containing protein [Eubacteriales bacterium OttesenSCG-928-M02]|nr:ANTAR domain-containing protein [Eubacteriales bacterium OttesenSCG-928-M02]
MESALLVSSGEKEIAILAKVMKATSIHTLGYATNGGEARRQLVDKDYDLVVVNTPLMDEFGDELAIYASEATLSGVILLAKSSIADGVAYRVEDYGVMVVQKPLSGPALLTAIHMLTVVRRRMLGLKRENIQLQDKILEMRLIDRAKFLLIQYMGMTEQAAHRYIEKEAMDRRESRRQVAEYIVEEYER